MKAVKMEVYRPTKANDSNITEQDKVGDAYVTYTPIRDYDLDLGGVARRTASAYDFIVEASTTDIKEADIFKSSTISMQVTSVYTYDNDFKLIDGRAEEVK